MSCIDRPPFVVPAWMEPYRDLLQNTGGNSIEALLGPCPPEQRYNDIRHMLTVAVESQVTLLARLHARGMLAEVPNHVDHVAAHVADTAPATSPSDQGESQPP